MSINTSSELPDGVCVLVDGGCKGPQDARTMYGSMTVFNSRSQITSRDDNGHKAMVHRFDIAGTDGTNNYAEVYMLFQAALYLLGLSQRTSLQGEVVTVVSDSEWGLNVVQGNYKLKAETRSRYNSLLIEVVKIFDILRMKGVVVQFAHANNLWVKEILGH